MISKLGLAFVPIPYIPHPLDAKTRPTYAVGALEEDPLSIEISALAELGATYLEVHGKVEMRQARRISDLANDEDELLELVEARLRVHDRGDGLWDSVPALTLNRDEVLLLIATAEHHTSQSDKHSQSSAREIRCPLT